MESFESQYPPVKSHYNNITPLENERMSPQRRDHFSLLPIPQSWFLVENGCISDRIVVSPFIWGTDYGRKGKRDMNHLPVPSIFRTERCCGVAQERSPPQNSNFVEKNLTQT